jgi:hypothetical protein
MAANARLVSGRRRRSGRPPRSGGRDRSRGDRRGIVHEPKTASVHVSSILRKLGVVNRAEAAAVGERAGLI